jgi:hypothetical protein
MAATGFCAGLAEPIACWAGCTGIDIGTRAHGFGVIDAGGGIHRRRIEGIAA